MRIVGPLLLCACFLTAMSGARADALVPFEVVEDTIPAPLTSQPGDAERGRAVYVDRDRGHCLLCHVSAHVQEPFAGTIGPDLSTVADVYGAGQLRYRVVDSTLMNPDTVMPSYYRVDGLVQVDAAFDGQPVLTAQEVEDLIAFLLTFRGTK